MKVIAAIEVDLVTTPLGTRSRCADELGGVPVLRRTVERLMRCRNLAGIHLLCPPEQVNRCSKLVDGLAAVVHPNALGPPPWRSLVQPARKWALDGWRGGIGGTTVFDEYTDPRVLSELLRSLERSPSPQPSPQWGEGGLKSTCSDINPQAVLSVPPAAPFFDPGIADRMIEHRRSIGDEARLVVTQSPPGMAGVLLDRELVLELGERGIPIGWLISYKPDAPQKDVIFTAACCESSVEVRHAVGRLIMDTDSSTRTIQDLHTNAENVDAREIARRMTEREHGYVPAMPREVEVELTTDDTFPDSMLHPRGSRVPRRGPIDVTVIGKLAAELARVDDSLVVLGGFGEPLRHPKLGEVLRTLRPSGRNSGVYGLAIRTTLVDLTDQHIDWLLECGVDVVEVMLDAWSDGLYATLHARGDANVGNIKRALAAIDRLSQRREQDRSATPIVVPSMTKCRENVHELDDFHDGWLRRVGAVAIHGYSHRAGQLEDRSVIRMTPPTRNACRRLKSRCVVLADGSVTLCDQDFKGAQGVGNLREHSLEAIWRGARFEHIRKRHALGDYAVASLCESCDEWHRP